MARSAEETYTRASRAVRAFLEGSETPDGLLRAVASSGARGPQLRRVFRYLIGQGEPQRYAQALTLCVQRGWLE